MTGALKLGIHHARKPYKFLCCVSVARYRASAPLKGFAAWWCGPPPYERDMRLKISSPSSSHWNHPHNRNRCSDTEHSRSAEREEHLRGRTRTHNAGTEMGAAIRSKATNEHDESGESPPQNCSDDQSVNSSKLLTLPTILTIARVVAVPLLVGAFYSDSRWGSTATTGIFIAAAITDWLDGYLARKMKMGTQFGAFLDPVADKLMVATTLILLCNRPYEVGLFENVTWRLTAPAIAIIGREITMSAVREWAAAKDRKLLKIVAVNNLGKWKTATQMCALTVLLAARDGSVAGAGSLATCGVVLLYISAWLSLWSLFVYMRKIWKVLLL